MQVFFLRVGIMVRKMYHPPSKRKQLVQRVAVYGLMTVSIVALVVVLVFVMLGYQFNKADGRIEQGGLVQFGTQPAGATVSIDGSDFGTRTPSKTTMLAGQHVVGMNLKNYEIWQKSVDVPAGGVLWLNYARLVPRVLTPGSVADFGTVSSTSTSPNKRWLAIKNEAETPVIQLADLSRDTVAMTKLTISATSFTPAAVGAKDSFSIEAWDPSSRYLLIKHNYGTGLSEWLVVDTRDATNTSNVTQLLAINASKLQFSNSNSRVLYGLIDGDIRKIDLDAQTISAPLVRNVDEFSLYDRATVVYTSRLVDGQRTAGYYNDGASKPRAVRSYSDTGKVPLHFALGKYYDSTYVAIAYGDAVEILKGTLPSSESDETSSLKAVATMTIPSGVQELSIITGGRFIVAQHGAAYSVYDLELSKMTTTRLKSGKVPKDKLNWADGYHVLDDQSGTVRMYEFDGANQYDIMPVVPGFSATLSPSGKYFYGITKDAKGYHLSRVQMVLG